MTKHKSIDDLGTQILTDVLDDFGQKGLGADELSEEYVGVPIIELKNKYCTDKGYSQVDFDLALKQLEENELVATGPTVAHENPPDSSIRVFGFYSKREFVYLTEKGYRAARKPVLKKVSPTPTVHISGGNFNNSPIGVGSTVNQTVNFNDTGTLNELQHLVEVFEKHIDELMLEPAAKRKATAQVATIKAQLEDEPDPVIITQAGRTLRNITEGVIGSLIATAAQPSVWAWVGQHMPNLFG
ncbi:MAG: hypothetical protein HGA78_02940 [Nitrospirales bacterium]|nr:hypothetical protein [Nitrospirales bacterium]